MLKITIRIQRRNVDGSLGVVEMESSATDMKTEDMRALWEAERVLNTLCADLRVHITLGEDEKR